MRATRRLPRADSSLAGSGVNELAFKFMVGMWLGSGVIGIVLLFRRGLAAALLRAMAERMGGGGVAIGWVALVVLMAVMIPLGMFSYLYTIVATDRIHCKKCGRRRGVLELYCANCERPVARMPQMA
jgi:hypothetical protein